MKEEQLLLKFVLIGVTLLFAVTSLVQCDRRDDVLRDKFCTKGQIQ